MRHGRAGDRRAAEGAAPSQRRPGTRDRRRGRRTRWVRATRRRRRRPVGRRGRGLAPDHHEPVDGGDGREHEHHPQHGHEDVEGEPDAEQHHPLEALHQPTPGVETERLRLGALVRDEHRQRDDGQHEDREIARPRRRGARRRRRGSPRPATRSQTESKNAPRSPAVPLWRATDPSRTSGSPLRISPKTASSEVAVRDQQRGADGGDETEDRERIGRDPEPVQRPADGLEALLGLGAPASVEHPGAVLCGSPGTGQRHGRLTREVARVPVRCPDPGQRLRGRRARPPAERAGSRRRAGSVESGPAGSSFRPGG